MDITYHGIKQLVLTVEVFKLFNYLATLTLLHFLLLLSKSIKKKCPHLPSQELSVTDSEVPDFLTFHWTTREESET